MFRKALALAALVALAACNQVGDTRTRDGAGGGWFEARKEPPKPVEPIPFDAAHIFFCDAQAQNFEAQWVVCHDKDLWDTDNKLANEWNQRARGGSRARLTTMEEDRTAFLSDLRTCVEDKHCMYRTYNKYLHDQVPDRVGALPPQPYPHYAGPGGHPLTPWEREHRWQMEHPHRAYPVNYGDRPHRERSHFHGRPVPTRVPPPGWRPGDDRDELSSHPGDAREACALKIGLRRAEQLADQCGPGPHGGHAECSVLRSCRELEENKRR